jgi:hypothetical protein
MFAAYSIEQRITQETRYLRTEVAMEGFVFLVDPLLRELLSLINPLPSPTIHRDFGFSLENPLSHSTPSTQ